MSNDIKVAYEQILKFYQIAGRLNPIHHEDTLDGIAHQLELIDEELKEAFHGFEQADAVELVDGAMDIFYVTCGLLQRLEAAGVNVQKALARVCENNLSKFPSSHEFEHNPELAPEGAEVLHTNYGHVVFKRPLDGKILKPTNYIPVDLTSCVPEDFFGTKEAEQYA